MNRESESLQGPQVHEHVPGKWELTFEVLEATNPRYHEVLYGSLRRGQTGYTLSAMREKLGGDDGFVVDPSGKRHLVSLSAWAKADPQSTRCHVGFRFIPERGHEGELANYLRELDDQEDAEGPAQAH